MYPDSTKLIYSIQRSNIQHEDRAFVVKAVQEYYKTLNQSNAIKPAKKVIKVKKENKEEK